MPALFSKNGVIGNNGEVAEKPTLRASHWKALPLSMKALAIRALSRSASTCQF
jgi:hypothetical protein